MAIGRISVLAVKAAQKAAKAAKAAKPKSLGTIPRGVSRSRVESAGNIPRLQRSLRNTRTRNALTDAAAMAGVAGIVGGAIYGGGKTKKATPVVPSAKKLPTTPIRKTPKPPAGLKKDRPTAKKAPAKKAVKKASPKKRVSRFDPMSQKKLKSLTGKNKLMYRRYLREGGTNKIIK